MALLFYYKKIQIKSLVYKMNTDLCSYFCVIKIYLTVKHLLISVLNIVDNFIQFANVLRGDGIVHEDFWPLCAHQLSRR